MDAPVVASRSFPTRPSLGEKHPANGISPSNLDLRIVASTGHVEKEVVGGGGGGGGGLSMRRRRHMRLLEKNPNFGRPSALALNISEHKSMDDKHLDKDRISLSTDATTATETTTVLTAETSETTLDNSVRVRRVPSTSSNTDQPASEDLLLPQSILTTAQTFPYPESQGPTPKRLTPPLINSARVATSESSPTPPASLLPPRRQRSQSLWDDSNKKELAQQISTDKILPPSTPTQKERLTKSDRLLKAKALVRAARAKPKLKRHSSTPLLGDSAQQTNVVDDVLMDRAFVIRQNLMNYEMQELAAEAEKAAESGLEKFVGSTSKFGVEETPPYRSKFVDHSEFVVSEGFTTPSRRKTLVDALSQQMDYTPSYFARKKIPVTSLRNFTEIVPNFADMHDNIRVHLSREGVNLDTLPDLHSRRSLIKNDTDDTEREDGEDLLSQAPSVAVSHAESISSFSSYAVASLASLKEVIEYVNKPKSPTENKIRHSLSLPVPPTEEIQQSSSLRCKSQEASNLPADEKKDDNTPLPHPTVNFRPVMSSSNSDSDDSSVELYGRKSPIDLNQSASSNVSSKLRKNQLNSSLSQSRSNISGSRRRKIKCSNVSFETEKANYRALLDKMNNQTSPNVSFDVDQSSCAPSLTTMDIDILSSSPTNGKGKSTPMANFLSKIGFSRSKGTDGHDASTAMEEENEYFVDNFFYTSQPSNIAEPAEVAPPLKLDINPETRGGEPYCLPAGCGANNLFSACGTATTYADLLFDWFTVGGNRPKKPSTILDAKMSDKESLHQTWMKTWQRSDLQSHDSARRVFMPPKLSVKAVATEENDIFCSTESGSTQCDVMREPLTCPEIQNKIGCSPESTIA